MWYWLWRNTDHVLFIESLRLEKTFEITEWSHPLPWATHFHPQDYRIFILLDSPSGLLADQLLNEHEQIVLFSFDHLKGSFLKSLDFHLSNSFCIWSVRYTTVKYKLNSLQLIYFPFNYFLITQIILFPRVKSLQSNTLKVPACLEVIFFYYGFFFFSIQAVGRLWNVF